MFEFMPSKIVFLIHAKAHSFKYGENGDKKPWNVSLFLLFAYIVKESAISLLRWDHQIDDSIKLKIISLNFCNKYTKNISSIEVNKKKKPYPT